MIILNLLKADFEAKNSPLFFPYFDFTETEPFLVFSHFNHFLQSYEVTKF